MNWKGRGPIANPCWRRLGPGLFCSGGGVLGVLHNHAFDHVHSVFAGVQAFFKALEQRHPGEDGERVFVAAEQLADALGVQGIPVAFQGVHLNDLALLEVAEFLDGFQQGVAAFRDEGRELLGLRANGLHVEHIHPAHNVVDGVHHVVQILGELDDVLPLDGGDELMGEHLGHIVAESIRGVFDMVHDFQLFAARFRREVGQRFFQVFRGLAGVARAGAEILEIVVSLFAWFFLRHDESSLKNGHKQFRYQKTQ